MHGGKLAGLGQQQRLGLLESPQHWRWQMLGLIRPLTTDAQVVIGQGHQLAIGL